MKFSLSTVGLSLTQATSISNLMNQRANDIARQLDKVNNSSKTLTLDGEVLDIQVGFKIPDNVIELIKEKAELHATQAFLMENVKYKDTVLKQLRNKPFTTELKAPEYPTMKTAERLPIVDEEWAWNQLTATEYNEYLEQEALAAHVGQFIHKNGKLDTLRATLVNEKPLEWMVLNSNTVNQKQLPVKVTTHHTPDQLLALHNMLAADHRKYEQRVNYYKAKIKNDVTAKNAEIANINADAQSLANKENGEANAAYRIAYQEFEGKLQEEQQLFEKKRQEDIKATANLRIVVDPRFQLVVDKYMKLIDSEELKQA